MCATWSSRNCQEVVPKGISVYGNVNPRHVTLDIRYDPSKDGNTARPSNSWSEANIFQNFPMDSGHSKGELAFILDRD